MKTLFLFFLSVVYLFLAFEMETSIGRKIYFFIALVLLLLAVRSYLIATHQLNKELAELQQASEEAFKKIPHTQYIMSEDYLSALLLNAHTNTLYIANREDFDEEISCKAIPFHHIYEVAILEDGNVVLKNARHNSGLIIKKDKTVAEDDEIEEDDEKVHKLSIKMVMDELEDPIVELIVLDSDKGLEKDDDLYKDAFEECEKWYQKMSILIKRYELEQMAVRKWQ